MTYRILVLEGMTDRGLAVLRSEGWQVDVQTKVLPPEELAALVPPYHAVTLRSGSKFNARVLEAATSLKVVGRPGIGVDNVDLQTATRLGIVVMNSPAGNVVSTAELALSLLFSLARNIAGADAAMKAERFDRKAFVGVELHGKRIGVLGLGRIGREVAARCRALGMQVLVHDPYVAASVAEGLGVTLLSLDELLQGCDFLTLHTSMAPGNRHLLGKEAFSKIKPGCRIVNAARGELIDEEALLAALESGRVAGAALDVHASEPPKDWRLACHPRVVATPHLGASTVEAQDRVGTDIAVQVRDFLKGGLILQAVNFYSLSSDLYDRVRPAMDLAERLGGVVGQSCQGSPERIEIGLYGDLRDLDSGPILAAAVAGVLRGTHPNVTVVNSRSLAAERGIDVVESTSSAPIGFSNLMAVRFKTAESDLSVAGTLFGRDHLRLVDVDGIEVDAIPQGHLLLVKNDDRPGVVGQLGTLLGTGQVNIARMTVGRKPGSGRAIMLIETDGEPSPGLLAEVAALPGVREVRKVRLG